MTIQNLQAHADSFWDWAIFDGCFGPGVSPMDLDGTVERNLWFLLFETKAPGVPIPKGELITFQSLMATKRFTILFMWGPRNIPVVAELWRWRSIERFEISSLKHCRAIATEWWQFANKRRINNDIMRPKWKIPIKKEFKMANVLTIHAKPAVQSPSNQAVTGKFVLADSDEVLKKYWPEQVQEPRLYASIDAALDAAEILFAVGQVYDGQHVITVTRVGNERVEVILAE